MDVNFFILFGFKFLALHSKTNQAEAVGQFKQSHLRKQSSERNVNTAEVRTLQSFNLKIILIDILCLSDSLNTKTKKIKITECLN